MNPDKKKRIARIFSLFSSKDVSPDLEDKVHHWLIDEEDQEEKKNASFHFWNSINHTPDEDAEEVLSRVNREIGENGNKTNLMRRLFYVAAVFASLFVLATGVMFVLSQNEKTIELVTGYGEKEYHVLPDGSEVRIQPGSKLTYQAKYKNGRRELKLSGEAFFNVKKDTEHPFTVQTNELTVQVLGTEFSIRSYPGDELITTTLASGQVEIHSDKGRLATLKPNEQFVYVRASGIGTVNQLTNNEVLEATAGALCFENATLSEILRSVERKYNVRIKQNSGHLRERYTVSFHKEDVLDTVLEVLDETVEKYSFLRSGDEVILKKDNE